MAIESIITFTKGIDWISKLYSRLVSGRIKFKDELEKINKIMFGDPLELAKYYVEPCCQNRNPADHHEENFLLPHQEPIMKKINQFFNRKVFYEGDNQLFILSDAGMGKSSFLTMLKLMHLTYFFPSKYNCELKKLGKDTLEEIEGIENKRQTILLLDSLDEDSKSYGRVKERLIEILLASKYFFRVIITCRTQFLPETEEETIYSIEGFKCPVKYLSFFDDDKVREYLNKRFPKKFRIFQNKKIVEAQEIIERMGSLRCRPLLLVYIEDFMEASLDKGECNEFKIYDELIKSWLRKEKTKEVDLVSNLYEACIILATYMQQNNIREVNEKTLDLLIDKISELKLIKKIEVKGRSLLNKTSEGEYRFSHYSIQEFCAVKNLINPIYKVKGRPVKITEFMNKMIQLSGERLRNNVIRL